jgi:hypothetical protein
MKIFQKTHFWQERRTFMEADAENPGLNERGYPKEGNVTVRIGDQEGAKGVFKLTVDEARALRDSVDLFLRKHDNEMTKLFNEGREIRKEIAQPEITPEMQPAIQPESFSIFDTEEKKAEPRMDYYY